MSPRLGAEGEAIRMGNNREEARAGTKFHKKKEECVSICRAGRENGFLLLQTDARIIFSNQPLVFDGLFG